MLDSMLLILAGASVGLFVRFIVGGKAYGAVADALLGITGAFVADWVIGQAEIVWSSRAVLTIWSAAFFPCVAHFLARRNRSTVRRQMRRGGF
jgi:uncharacterized membrane protein YeaQ/YmgE (transglycosylase-associated protein family)